MRAKRTLTFKGKSYSFDAKNNIIKSDMIDDDIDMPQELLDIIKEVKLVMEKRAYKMDEEIVFDEFGNIIPPEELKYYEVEKGSAEEADLIDLGIMKKNDKSWYE